MVANLMHPSDDNAITSSEMALIVAQASFLNERLHDRMFEVEATQTGDTQAIANRLNRWCQVTAQGNWDTFQRRLQWDELDVATVRSYLGAVQLVDDQALPTWAETLQTVMQTAQDWATQSKEIPPTPLNKGGNGLADVLARGDLSEDSNLPCCLDPDCLDPDDPLPFEDLWLPALHVARRQLNDALDVKSLPGKLLSQTAYLSLERSLLQRLVRLSTKTLEFEFSRFRPLGHSLLNLLIQQPSGTPQKIYYHRFVQELWRDGLLTFFQQYPVLGRLVATAIDFWVESTAEFLQRLEADLADIWQTFGKWGVGSGKWEVGSEKVIEIKPSLSDFHHRGRTVIALTFESGLKLVYKPKSLGIEVAYNQFLAWCNDWGVRSGEWGTWDKTLPQQAGLLPFKVLKVLNRQDYGWVEYVEPLPCKDEAAAQRFYRRAGMLLGLLYVLGGTDCHHGNLIASGDHLVLVDMETLLHPESRLMDESPEAVEAEASVIHQFWDSVLRTGLLPRWEFSPDHRLSYDISGLGSVDPQQAPRRMWQWKAINTDDMHLAAEAATMSVGANVPILNGQPLSPNEYLAELVRGFEQMYRFLIRQRAVLLSEDGPLAAFREQPLRFVFRATQVYGMVLHKSLTPDLLRDGVSWSIELDVLSRAFLAVQQKPDAWPILQAEQSAMQQLDIPYFRANSSRDALLLESQPIGEYFKAASYQQVEVRSQQLSETDLAQQVAIIQGALCARVARSAQPLRREPPPDQVCDRSLSEPTDGSPIHALTAEQLLEHATAIAQEIQARAIWETNGSVNWIGLGYVANADRFQLQPLGITLYDGRCGIALFLAALDDVSGRQQFRDLALGAVQSFRTVLRTADPMSIQRTARSLGMGGASGLGSIIYAFVRISHFLQEPNLIEDALNLAEWITPELIATDQALDIISGSAGAILGLLALYRDTEDPRVLERAIACGQQLLHQRVSHYGLPRAWKTLADQPLTGFSHGAAGIAYALLRLYAVTQDSAYLAAAMEGIAYERCAFSAQTGNWYDFRFKREGQLELMSSWCHGAPGIGLARLGGLSILATDDIHQDIAAALQVTQTLGVREIDHLCCGNAGLIEVLLIAAQTLPHLHNQEIVQQRVTRLVTRATQTGNYQLFNNLPHSIFHPSFFQGTAGIGYELLRVAYPERLPSVLLWE